MNKFKLFTTTSSLLFLFAFSTAYAQNEKLVGGNLEDASKWQTSYLNTTVGSEPTVEWNTTTNVPTAGDGGALFIEANAPVAQSQYAIYQKVTLSKDSLYSFDGAFVYTLLNNAWCEIFIGTEPVADEDYGSGQFKLVEFSFWNNPAKTDGIFSADGKNYQSFSPETSGDFYFVFKTGCLADGQVSISVDELSLVAERVKPVTDFSADVLNGFAPLEVQFTDESDFATSWSWDFGDGSGLSTEQNPKHTFSTAGTYTVTLTATNELGSTELVKTGYINVNPPEQLTAARLAGGNMEDESKWQVSFLSTAADQHPVASWNNTEKTPSAGRGGALVVTGNAPANATVQYAIYQKITLSKDSVYTFDAAMKDFSESLNQAWYEVYIGDEPIDGLDYTKDDHFLLSEFSTWSQDCNPKGVDGTFLLNACGNNSFNPEVTGDFYFVLKLGSWSGGDFVLAVDELSLKAERVKPEVSFSADKPLGFAPLTVQFTDESKFGTSWEWNFGDGSALSTEQNPVHVYTVVGTYDVTLAVTNEKGTTTLVKSDYIKANEKPQLPPGEMLYGGNMEDPNLWNITTLNATEETSATWNNTAQTPSAGAGGNLLLSAAVKNQTSQYCIWQEVELTAGMRYTFDAAFKDLSTDLNHFWSEVFIGTEAPVDGLDYSKDDHTLIAFFNSWDCGSAAGLDGTYGESACGTAPVGVFVPETTGKYYFAIKTGITDWEGVDYSFSVIIDEVTLKESENIPDPVADFFADVTSGDAPLSVYFFNLSKDASTYSWDFGDGSSSTEESPTHSYTSGGIYTVSLTAYNDDMVSNTLTVDDLITVNGTTGIDELENGISLYPNPTTDFLYVKGIEQIIKVDIFNMKGQKIRSAEAINQKINVGDLPHGIYVIAIENKEGEVKLSKFSKK